MKRLLILPALCLLAALSGSAALAAPQSAGSAEVMQAVPEGEACLTPGALEQRIRGSGSKPLLVIYWATWCGPCLREIPGLMRLRETTAADDLDMLAVSFDVDPEAHSRFLTRRPLNFPSCLGSTTLMQSLGITAIPRLEVWKDGLRLGVFEGAAGHEEIKEFVERSVSSGE